MNILEMMEKSNNKNSAQQETYPTDRFSNQEFNWKRYLLIKIFGDRFWRGEQKLFIAYKLLRLLFVLLLLILLGSFFLTFFRGLETDSPIVEIFTIVAYGAFNIISLIIGFVAGASLDKRGEQ